MFAWLFLLFHTAKADCLLNKEPIQHPRVDIEVSDLQPLIEKAKGCTVVIEIWASWCAPCVKIAPEVHAFHQSHPNIPVISISADATGVAAEQFWKKYPTPYQKRRFTKWSLDDLADSFSTVGATFPDAIPYFVVLNANGVLVFETHEPKSLVNLIKAVDSIAEK